MVCKAECTRSLPYATLNPVEREPHLQRCLWYFWFCASIPTSYCTRCFQSWLLLETKVGQACGLVILTQISRQLWSCIVPECTRRPQPGDTSPRLVCAVQHVLLFYACIVLTAIVQFAPVLELVDKASTPKDDPRAR